MDAFIDDERGYTSIAMALALMLSVVLVFSAASSLWLISRSADVQEVADATALAGSNVVGSYATVAHVLDACVLSMGLAGLATCASGLVLLCIPGAQAAGEAAFEAGRQVLSARSSFASSAYAGLERIEGMLPGIIGVNSASVAFANSEGGIGYAGCAIPFPLESKSQFPQAAVLGEEELDDAAKRLGEASRKAESAQKKAEAAQQAGWMADCGARPYCMRQRAQTLAGLAAADNPDYPTPKSWTFGAAILRARAYYAERIRIEAPLAGGIEALTDSLARSAYYDYALEQVRSASYHEAADGSVELYLPELPRNASEVRQTRLYTDARWPCTMEGEARVLHSTLACPGATGAAAGAASLAQQEGGEAGHCEICRMDVGDLGKTPAASTSIDNGFEHWWRELVRASKEFESARKQQVAAEKEMRDAGLDGDEAFSRALDAVSAARPRLCPPGAWGTVACVMRPNATASPSELAGAFSPAFTLPEGVALSAAVCAPEAARGDSNVLASFLDGLAPTEGISLAGAAGGVLSLWGELLLGYESVYDGGAGAITSFLDKVDGVLGTTVGSWLKQQLAETVRRAGLEPVELRLAKPVLVSSATVFAQAGFDCVAAAQNLIARLPRGAGPAQTARALGLEIMHSAGKVTIATIPIPGTGIEIPLTIDLEALAGAL